MPGIILDLHPLQKEALYIVEPGITMDGIITISAPQRHDHLFVNLYKKNLIVTERKK